MASMLPPDPYKALGLTKDADAATIKSTYRKLALKCHPDKVSDESLKQQKQEEFHKIQQAYELIGDEDKRATYDAEVRLDLLRREKLSRGEPRVEVKTARYEVRTAAPAGATFSASGQPRYDERKTSRSFEDERYWDDRARKFETYDPYPKHSSTRTARPEKEPAIRVRVTSDRTRSDHKKTRERDRDRSGKFVYVEDDTSSNDEKARFESSWHRRNNEDDVKKAAADARRKAEDRRSYEEPQHDRQHERQHDRQRKLSDQTSEAMHHILHTKGVVDPRPTTIRTSSSREIRPEIHDRSSRRDRTETARRSSARPKEHRDRKGVPEIVEWGEDDRKVPSFKHSSSSPADIHLPPTRVTPQRAYTEAPPSREHRRTESSPTPAFRRSETMPIPHTSSSRKTTTPRSSTLRSSENLAHHEPLSRSPEAAYPIIPPPQSSSSKKYYYHTQAGGVRLVPADVEVANGHRTILHEPNRHRTRSPSPLTRPPMGPNAPKLSVPPPPLGRAATVNISPAHGDDRGRSRPSLYGEIPQRENARRHPSYSPEAVTYSRKIGPDDIKWSRGRESIDKDREYTRPTLTRPATFAY